MTAPRLLVALAATFLLLGYLIGYADSKHTWERMRRAFATNLHELEARVIGLQNRLSRDPERAAMDHGEIFVINQIENLTRQMREDITDRQTTETDR
jgi:hypothetical protein